MSSEMLKLLGEAFIVMIMGIGVVFIFLIILVIFISLTGMFIRLFNLEKEEKVEELTPKKSDDTQIIAAIVAAIKNYTK